MLKLVNAVCLLFFGFNEEGFQDDEMMKYPLQISEKHIIYIYLLLFLICTTLFHSLFKTTMIPSGLVLSL